MAFKYTRKFFSFVYKIIKFIYNTIVLAKFILFSFFILSLGYYLDVILSYLSEFLFFMSYIQDLLDMLPKP